MRTLTPNRSATCRNGTSSTHIAMKISRRRAGNSWMTRLSALISDRASMILSGPGVSSGRLGEQRIRFAHRATPPLRNAPVADGAHRNPEQICMQIANGSDAVRIAQAQKRVLQSFVGEIRGSGSSRQTLFEIVVTCDEEREQRRSDWCVAHWQGPHPQPRHLARFNSVALFLASRLMTWK